MKKCWILRLGSVVFVMLSAALGLSAQSIERPYIFPVYPGETNTLSGTMGELRATHFHSGIDIRTGGRTGLPIQAVADGFIVRASMATGGYGNALYLFHPKTGHYTVYAHLESFHGPVRDYVLREQYQQETFEINLFPAANSFKVKQGDTIAYSGNSGSSGGPHLHFDLRDKNHNLLNPLSYGFKEVKDQIPPVVEQVAVKTLNMDSRVEHMFGRQTYRVRRISNGRYTIDKPIPVWGLIGLEMFAYDRMDGTNFKCGINQVEVAIDGEPIFTKEISTFSFNEQRNILAHMNFEVKQTTGTRYQKLYVDYGNDLTFYNTNKVNGRINVTEPCMHQVTVQMWDSYGNASLLEFRLEGKIPEPISRQSSLFKESYEVVDNTLVLYSEEGEDSLATLFFQGKSSILHPSYTYKDGTRVFLWDLRQALPDSVWVCGVPLPINFKAMVLPEIPYRFYSHEMDVYFPPKSLFDTLYLKTDYEISEETGREVFTVSKGIYPLRKNITITLKPQQSYKNKNKTSAYLEDVNGNLYYQGGTWKQNKFEFTTREFGRYTLAADTIPPEVKPLVINRKDLKFRISDSGSGIKDFRLEVDGQWVLMHYDYKTKLIWSERKEPGQIFKGPVKLIVKDFVGNENVYTTQIP